MMNVQVIPTLMEKDILAAEDRLRNIIDLTRWIQVDVTDNVLVEGKSFELELLTRLEVDLSHKLIDIHLMVKDPEKWIEKCIFVGANRVIGQVEMMENRESFVTKLKNEGIEAGLAFDIETPIGNLPNETDEILLMGRKMGFGIVPLDNRIFDKAKTVANELQGIEREINLAVDGGVTKENLEGLRQLGVDIFYVGQSFLDIANDKN